MKTVKGMEGVDGGLCEGNLLIINGDIFNVYEREEVERERERERGRERGREGEREKR